MPDEVKSLHSSLVPVLKQMQESQFIDFKAKEIEPSKISRAIAAFCNSDGGSIIIGIGNDPPRKWVGFSNIEEANPLFQVIHQVFPLSNPVTATFYSANGENGLIFALEMAKTAHIVKATDGTIYVRRGAQSLPVTTPDQIKQLELAKGVSSHEDVTIRDDLNNIVGSRVFSEFMETIVPNAEKEVWLSKQRLVDSGLPTVAAELLFSDEPQVVLPKSAAKIYRYKTTDPEGKRENLEFQPISIEGSIYSLIHAAVEKTVEITESIPVLGKEGLEKIRYPREAIHEVITNAVIHRDYSLNDDIHVRIFDNRIEVQSPGKLPAYITPKNILSERFARNPKLVRLLNKFPDAPNKDVGEGLNTTFEAMRKLNLKDPLISQTENAVLVVLRHEQLASLEDRLMDHLKRRPNEPINNALAREICNESSESKIRKAFQRMMKAKMIEKVPGTRGKGTKYRLKMKGK